MTIRRTIGGVVEVGKCDEPDRNEIISSQIEGMSVRIDLRNLDAVRRRAMLAQLAAISEQLAGQEPQQRG